MRQQMGRRGLALLLSFAMVFSMGTSHAIATETDPVNTPQTTQEPIPQTTQTPAPQTTQEPIPQTTQTPAPQTTQEPIPQATQTPAPQATPTPAPEIPAEVQALMDKIDALPDAADITAETAGRYKDAFEAASADYASLFERFDSQTLDAFLGAARMEKLAALRDAISSAMTLADPTPTAGTITTIAELNAAVVAVAEGGTIQLTGTITGTMEIKSDNTKNFTLDLAGYTLNGGSVSAICHYGAGTLTVVDTGSTKGKVTSADPNAYNNTSTRIGGTIVLTGNATQGLILDGVLVENTLATLGDTISSASVINNYSAGTLTIKNSTIENAGRNPTIVNTGALTIDTSTVAAPDCNAIHNADNGSVTVSNKSEITSKGFAIYSNSTNKIDIDDSKLTTGITGTVGTNPAIYIGNKDIDTGTTISITGGSVVTSNNGNNSSNSSNGTICLKNNDTSTLTITGSTVENTSSSGLAIYIKPTNYASKYTTNISGSTVTSDDGYAIYCRSNAPLTITDSTITSAHTTEIPSLGKPATIYVNSDPTSNDDVNPAPLTITNSQITNIATGGSGHAIYSKANSDIAVSGGSTVSTTSPSGAAIWQESGGKTIIGNDSDTTQRNTISANTYCAVIKNAITNNDIVTIVNSDLSSKDAAGTIRIGGTPTLTPAIKITNSAVSTDLGIAIYNGIDSEITVDGCTVTAKNSPAIHVGGTVNAGNVTVKKSTLTSAVDSPNGTIALAGGATTAPGKKLTITGSTVENIGTGKAIYNLTARTIEIGGTADGNKCTISADTGIAIHNLNQSSISIINSEITSACANSGTTGTIYLQDNTDATGATLKIDAKSTVENTGLGHAITSTKTPITVSGGSTVSAKDGNAIYKKEGVGPITIEGDSTVSSTGTNHTIYNKSTGNITVTGSGTEAAKSRIIAVNASAICNESNPMGSITITGSEITSAYAISAVTGEYGTISLRGTTATSAILSIDNSTVTNTATTGYGNAIFNRTSASISITNQSKITASNYGFAILDQPTVMSTPANSITISDSTLESTCIGTSYGTIAMKGPTITRPLTITNSTVTNTAATNTNTAAIHNETKGSITISGTSKVTSNNIAIRVSSGSTSGGGTVTIDGTSEITGSSASNGTIQLDSASAALIIKGTSKVENTSTGSAIHSSSSTGNITIESGTVTSASGSDKSTIYKNSGAVTVNGGTVSCTGDGHAISSASTSTVTVSGGMVTGNGIASTIYNSGSGAVTVSGGMVLATGTGYVNAISSTSTSKVIVKGGSINTIVFTPDPSKPTNSSAELELYTLTITGKANTAVTALTLTTPYTYGMKDVKTDANGKLYVWLPTGKTTATVTIDGKQYSGTITGNAATLTLVKAPGPAAPADLGFSFDGTNAGKIMGTTNAMEYSIAASVWTVCTATSTALTADQAKSITPAYGIKVRFKETETEQPSTPATISITAGGVVSGVTAIDCTTSTRNDGKLTGVTALMEYKKADETSWTEGPGTEITGLAAGTYHVRHKATGTVQYGATTDVPVAAGPTTITTKAIVGVTAPVINGTPVTAITGCDQYTGTVAWSGNPTTFLGGTVYTATITLTPKTGYTLTGVTANFFTVEGAAATNVADSGIITATFPATAGKTLAGILVTTQPTKTNYVHGDTFEDTGMVVEATYDDGTVDADFKAYTVPDTSLTKGTTSITITANGSSITATLAISVGAKTITITGVTAKTRPYDGTTNVELDGGTLVGVVSGDTVSFTLPTANTVTDANVGDSKAVTIGTITLTGAGADNYTLTQPTGITVDITKAQITAGVIDTLDPSASRTYVKDDKNFSDVKVTYTGVNGEAPTGTVSGAVASADAGTYNQLTGTTGKLDNGFSNYKLADNVTFTGTVTITKAAEPPVTDNAVAVLYDATNTTHTLTGLPTPLGGTPSYSIGNVADDTSILGSSSVDANGKVTYQLASGLTSTAVGKTATIPVIVTCGNYADFTVNLVITVKDKENGDAKIMFSGSSIIYGYAYTPSPSTTMTSGGTWSYQYVGKDGTTYPASPIPPKAVGTYTVTATYENTTQRGSKAVSLTINQKALRIKDLKATDRPYNGTTTVQLTGGSLVDVVSTDTNNVTFTLPTPATSTIADANASDTPKQVTFDNITLGGSAAGNYTLIQPSVTVTISKVQLTGGTVDGTPSKDYDGNVDFTNIAVTYTGGVNSETVKGKVTGTTEDANAGTNKALTVTDQTLDGNFAINYTTPSIDKITGNVEIKKVEYLGEKTASSAVPSNKVTTDQTVDLPSLPDGASYPAIGTVGGTTTGLISSHSIADNILTFSTTSQPATSATITVPVTNATNYNDYDVIVTVTATAKTSVIVSAAPATDLVYTGAAQNGYTGTPTSEAYTGALVYTYTGTGTTSYPSTSTAPTNAGTYKLVISVPEDNDDYIGSSADINFTIAQKEVTVKADNKSMTINGTLPAFTVSYTGFVGKENDDNAALATPAVAVCTADGKTLGAFPITLKPQAVLNNSVGANYTLNTQRSDGTLTVNAPSSSSGSSSDYDYSSSGSSPSNSNSNIIVIPPTVEQPADPTQVKAQIPTNVNSNGKATTGITERLVNEAISKATTEAKKNGDEANGLTLILHITTEDKTVNNVNVNLPKAVQEKVIKEKIINTLVMVDQPDVQIGMDLAAMKEINQQAGADVNIAAIRTDSSKLTGEAKTLVGDRPVFDLSINYGSGKTVNNFGTGSVTITIPYTLKDGEKAENICAVYVDEDGSASIVPNSVYNVAKKAIIFSTGHFSTYAVGYRENAPIPAWENPFTDVAESAWYFDGVRYAVQGGLFTGTSKTTFAPENNMTRAMLWTVLARLDGQDLTGGETYYAKAQTWVKEQGISDGLNPNENISREQLATILYRYDGAASVTGNLAAFSDAAEVSSYAQDAMIWAVETGIISGSNGKLMPQGKATRAELATILYRLSLKKQ